ncbi:MAG: hypothetical protein KUG71_03675 [Porticoccaceae bacterium]|nr:hypothetical protein [Porticoccaceae bacterium]
MNEKKRDDPADWFMLIVAIFIAWLPVIVGELNKHQQAKQQNPTAISNEQGKK